MVNIGTLLLERCHDRSVGCYDLWYVTVLLNKHCRQDGLSPAFSEETLSNPMPGNTSTTGCINSCFNVASKFSTLSTFGMSLRENPRHFGEMSSEKNP